MKVLQINSVCGIRSTGRICVELAEQLEREGHEVKIAYGREKVPQKYEKYAVRIGSEFDVRVNALKARCFDNEGFNAQKQTKKFLKWAEEYNPDLLWLHNLHGYYINVELLFEWIKSRPNMQVKWLLHDCWAFTGHCSHFSMKKCYKWKASCSNCPQKKEYPGSIFADNSRDNFERKKSAFTGVKNMTLLTPSNWLADLVRQSFLKEYPIEVRYNTIDSRIFKPTPSDFRQRYGLDGKKVVLGVSSVWNERKGLNDFIKLSDMLDDRYCIFLVGLSRKQINKLPQNIMAIERTDNAIELAEIYTAADIFLNPSKEETFGLTTVESLACGTFPVVYKGTACEEIVNLYGGAAVADNVQSLFEKVQEVTKCDSEH